MYAVMTALVWPDLHRLPVWKRVAVMVAGGFLVGTVFELLQGLVPGRSPEVRDVLADVVGVGVGLTVVAAINATKGERPLKAN
jgi:VanZ family protein